MQQTLRIVPTSNVVRAVAATRALVERAGHEEGMGLIYGRPGEGKTTTVSYLLNQFGGVFLRATVAWTVTSMLRALMVELELEPQQQRAPMIESAIEALSLERRPIFVDEADYLLRQMDMLDALRDIYDMAGAPVILITMETAPRLIRTSTRLSRFRRRITQWIEFAGLTLEDARAVAKSQEGAEIAADLVAHVHEATQGNIGLMVSAFARITRFAETNSLGTVRLEDYADRALLPHMASGAA